MHEQRGGASRKYEEESDAERKQRLYVAGTRETREREKKRNRKGSGLKGGKKRRRERVREEEEER